MTDVLNLVVKKHPSKLKETSPRENQFNAGPHGGKELLYHLMRQFFQDVLVGASPVGVNPDLLSMVVRIMSTEAGANSLRSETRPVAGSINAKIVAGISGTVIVIASEVIGAATNSTVPDSAVEV